MTADARRTPPSGRAILFRFHRHPPVCLNRVRLLRLFNPGVPVFGMYGGREDEFARFEARLRREVDDLHCIAGKTPAWKWTNGDLAVRDWFGARGRRLAFDTLHVIEWDMLVLAPLAHVFGHVPAGTVALSGLGPLEGAPADWLWTTAEPYKSQWAALAGHIARISQGRPVKHYTCIAGGAVLPREFLERYLGTEVPELGNDELRMPLYAQVFGLPLLDTGIFSRRDEGQRETFRLGSLSIRTARIVRELARADGARVFHPYRKTFGDLVWTDRWFNAWYSVFQDSRPRLRHALKRLRACRAGNAAPGAPPA